MPVDGHAIAAQPSGERVEAGQQAVIGMIGGRGSWPKYVRSCRAHTEAGHVVVGVYIRDRRAVMDYSRAMVQQAQRGDFTPRPVPVADLFFDGKNPRLSADPDVPSSQTEIFNLLWRDFAVDELASSIAANGYFPHEPLFVIDETNGGLVVVEGNRRLAALKAILGLEVVEHGVRLPDVDTTVLDSIFEVPVVITTREAIWQYVGFKHVNGPQAWQSVSKAKYVEWVHETLHVPLDDIARQIGDRHFTVLRLYRAKRVLLQAEDWGVFSLVDRWKDHFSFSHLYTGLDYNGIQAFIDVAPASEQRRDPVPESSAENLGQLCTWLYGSKSRHTPPLITSQNPDLRILDDVLRTANGLAALRQGLPLRVSQEIGKGDPRVLRESLVTAKNSLQTARGKVITGFDGEADLISLSRDIVDLAEAIVDDMRRAQRRASRRKEMDDE